MEKATTQHKQENGEIMASTVRRDAFPGRSNKQAVTTQHSNDPFRDRLDQHPGGPWYPIGALHEPDEQVLQLSEIDPQQRWSEPHAFLNFLDRTAYRRLLHCFIGGNALEKNRVWSPEILQQRTQLPLEDLEEALAFCHQQAFAIPEETRESRARFYQHLQQLSDQGKISFEPTPEHLQKLELLPEKPGRWYSNPELDQIQNFGPTFEWVIQALLEQAYSALARRHVQLSSFLSLGDLDVLAFLPDGRSLLVECKSSTKHITDAHLCRFFHKAHTFKPDVALLLIDANDPLHMQQRMTQFYRTCYREYGTFPIGNLRCLAKSSMLRIQEQVFVADAGLRLSVTLHYILHYQRYGDS
jgi:hypothetical protein